MISKVALIIRLHRAVRRARQVYEFTKHCPVGLAQVNVWSVGVVSVPVSVPGMLTASSWHSSLGESADREPGTQLFWALGPYPPNRP